MTRRDADFGCAEAFGPSLVSCFANGVFLCGKPCFSLRASCLLLDKPCFLFRKRSVLCVKPCLSLHASCMLLGKSYFLLRQRRVFVRQTVFVAPCIVYAAWQAAFSASPTAFFCLASRVCRSAHRVCCLASRVFCSVSCACCLPSRFPCRAGPAFCFAGCACPAQGHKKSAPTAWGRRAVSASLAGERPSVRIYFTRTFFPPTT